MSSFEEKGYHVIKEFLLPTEVSRVSRYFENAINRRFCDEKGFNQDLTSTFFCYADPLIELFLEDKADSIGKTVGRSLYPTYSYMRVYMDKDELKAHTDRPECEYSVTVHVAKVGEDWPIGIKDIDGNDNAIVLNAGDALVYRGCDLLHWRKPMNETKTKLNAQFMLHYVDKTGPYSICKWDGRPKLGLSSTSKVR
tara:strand:- start:248 stop:835 length:588 start_codon:yes stop_codon:yes gene_type:complete